MFYSMHHTNIKKNLLFVERMVSHLVFFVVVLEGYFINSFLFCFTDIVVSILIVIFASVPFYL